MTGRKTFLVASLLYFLLAFFFFPYLRFYIDNPDSLEYITIALKYAHGNFANAINGYWSPLISWLLAVPLFFHANAILSFKILQLLIGWFALYNWIKLLEQLLLRKIFRLSLSVVVIPFLLSYSLLNLTPDLLFLSLILFYVRIISGEHFFRLKNFGMIAGIAGAMLFLTKAFGFYFFIAHFLIIIVILYKKHRNYFFRINLVRNIFLGMIAFFLISGVWIYMISHKYGHFTISEAASFNMSREVATLPEQTSNLPILKGGLYAPPNDNAVNAWEDPGQFVKLTTLHPLSNKEDLEYYTQVVKRNLLTIYYYDFRNQAGLLFLLIFVLVFLGARIKLFFLEDNFIILIVSLLLIYGGYSLVLVHTRYIWVNTFLMLLIGAVMVQFVAWKSAFLKTIGTALFFAMMLISVKRPIKELFLTEDKSASIKELSQIIIHPINTLTQTYKPDMNIHGMIEQLKQQKIISGNIASLKNNFQERDNYSLSSLIAFSTSSKFFGMIDSTGSFEEQFSLLKKSNINYFIVPNSEGWKGAQEKRLNPVYKNETANISVYKIE